ncbi:C-C chemokine receptor type 5-like [Myxocyprinus asiaticus]|uniref:C-C chemokine receptor type 5-like n=1 Tax=Myxocyprinus asiaticus TaxID=70543 RepID=UPI0022228D64|nr:C-C chemokine receptor type 5-like [Myxocyprinus asiaticus]
MNNSTVNFTTPEASTNSTTHSIITRLDICVYSINFLFGLPIHSYVIWLIVTGSGIASEFFNLNLSVSEIGNCLNCLFFVLSVWFSSLMKLTQFSFGLVLSGRPLFQCLICVERYLAVVHPVTFLKFKPLRFKMICSTVAWIICLCFCLVCMLTIDSENIVHLWFLSIQFLLVLSIQLFCLSAVLRALKQSGPGERVEEREKKSHIKRRAFYLILITTVNMVIIYVPNAILGFFTVVTKQYIHAVWYTGWICYALAGYVHPVLYLHRVGKLSCLCSP